MILIKKVKTTKQQEQQLEHHLEIMMFMCWFVILVTQVGPCEDMTAVYVIYFENL